MLSQDDHLLLKKIYTFLTEIGINITEAAIQEPSFLPGLQIKNGTLIIDVTQLKYVGDILHEAGHIAIVPYNERIHLNEADIALRPNREAEEMMTIAWSYAAATALDIDPYIVFHDNGYKGGGSYLADNFNQGRYIGVPMLQWKGMAIEKRNDDNNDLPIYPKMIHWLHP